MSDVPFWQDHVTTPGGLIVKRPRPLFSALDAAAAFGVPVLLKRNETFTVRLTAPPCGCPWCIGEAEWSDNLICASVIEEGAFTLPCSRRAWEVRLRPPWAFMSPTVLGEISSFTLPALSE